MAFKLNNGNGSFTLPPVNVYVCFVIYLLSLCLSVCLSSLYKLVQDICLLVFILSCSSSPLFLLSVHAMHFCFVSIHFFCIVCLCTSTLSVCTYSLLLSPKRIFCFSFDILFDFVAARSIHE